MPSPHITTLTGDDSLPFLPPILSNWYSTLEELSDTLARLSLKEWSVGNSPGGEAPSPLPASSGNPAAVRVQAELMPVLVTPEYGLPAKQVRRMSAEANAVLLDVRDAVAFERVSLPDSQNMPLFAVKTKTWLKSRPVILVDEGFRPRELNGACKRLRQSGFDVWFLLGGLAGWKVSGGALEGDAFVQRSLNRLSAEHWLTGCCKGCRLVIDASVFRFSRVGEFAAVNYPLTFFRAVPHL